MFGLSLEYMSWPSRNWLSVQPTPAVQPRTSAGAKCVVVGQSSGHAQHNFTSTLSSGFVLMCLASMVRRRSSQPQPASTSNGGRAPQGYKRMEW